METGLLIIRVAVGLLLIGHGTQKLFGWFGGYGLSGTGGFMSSLGYRPGRFMAALAGIGEAGGGTLLLLGLLTPLGSIAVMGTMLNVVVAAHWGKGPWATNGGWELPALFGAVGAMLAFTGPGELSLDNALGLDLAGATWGMVAVGTAFVIGVLTAATRDTGVVDVTDSAATGDMAEVNETESV